MSNFFKVESGTFSSQADFHFNLEVKRNANRNQSYLKIQHLHQLSAILRKMGQNLCVQGLTRFSFADGVPASRQGIVNHRGSIYVSVKVSVFLMGRWTP